MPTNVTDVDVLVIGGGVNGVGIAMDGAGRGLKVALCEMHDLASATSSNSSKLIHGGLRYLEHYEFALVKKALAEREVLLANAPHIMWPLRFRLPHQGALRPAWMLRLGLYLYDHLAKRSQLPSSHSVRFSTNSPLKSSFTKGFEYSDGWVDDARLVVLCAMAAQQHGAEIKPRTACISAQRTQGVWQVILENADTHTQQHYRAKVLINAAGPWASSVFDKVIEQAAPQQLRLVKGSHIVVPQLHSQPQAYILQHIDHRIVFVIPYEQHFSLIGTTDVDYQGDPAQVAISTDEIDYLCQVANDHFSQQISAKDVVWSYAGVRPLIEAGQAAGQQAQTASRDYRFTVDAPQGGAPLLSVFGGKLTTYRLLSEDAVNAISPYFAHISAPWTKDATLPGGDFSSQPALIAQLRQHYPWLNHSELQRWVRSYGRLCVEFLPKTQHSNHTKPGYQALGEHFGCGLYQAEVDYLMRQEWAYNANDILWRRTKLGLSFNEQQIARLQQYMQAKHTL
ncbi:glycerol-3-phosphate dehydrogenase [Oceanisphaera pacifica]|uniref:Glycerol-3-phosphate dehydrogenase n=1 Tax=Oceanisphaera pacifica TaxID=2818389 RepID=A0ABS3NFZ6_9GAMM|nr:glycerol-3-phosphate dehydrogenase [Oceanisphaera pacifica]MBO1519509.1 glycerol-3-phosphate dehydrogenase [Oceanisphaera pacifica]